MLRVLNKEGYRAKKSNNDEYIKTLLADGWVEEHPIIPKEELPSVKKKPKKKSK